MNDDMKSLEAHLDALLSETVEDARIRANTAFDKEVSPYKGQFVLFGSGNMGCKVLARLREDGIEPIAFADNNKANWGKTVDGLPVLSAEDAALKYGKIAAFIVTIYNNKHSFPNTRNQLYTLGCEKVVSVIPLRWKYHKTFLPYFRDDLPYKVLLQADSIRKAFHLWSDDLSRHEFVTQVEWRLYGDFDVLSPPCNKESYFPQQEIFRLRSEEFFVDIGAYDGDTIRTFLDLQGNEFSRIVALEPDPTNFNKLNNYIASLPDDVNSKIEAHPYAVGENNCYIRFASDEGTSSAVSQLGDIEVECRRIDDLLVGCQPTYIKMDIEGAELDAIEGAKQTINSEKPLIAACAYHVQDHLWNIPLKLHQLNPGYCFFLRTYMTECWETVSYAVPPERQI
ncbi:MAG: FkbM family methyltransferase [Proteobacteria bacterium]|nr:FkbM family methyltransferase [Pseudomonadota bacterium]